MNSVMVVPGDRVIAIMAKMRKKQEYRHIPFREWKKVVERVAEFDKMFEPEKTALIDLLDTRITLLLDRFPTPNAGGAR